MFAWILKGLMWFASTETARELGKHAYNKLLKSANDKISNKDVSEFLEKAIASEGNPLSVTVLNDLKKVTKSEDLRSILDITLTKVVLGKQL